MENICGAIFFITGAIDFYYFDKILKAEYSRHYDQWLKDGSPIGFFWVPKGAKLLAGGFSRDISSFKWIFSSPDWAYNDKEVMKYLKIMRISGAIGVIAWLIIVIGVVTKYA